MRERKLYILPEYPPVVLNETELTRPHPSTIHQVPITHEQPTHLPTTNTSSIHTPTPTIQKVKTTNHQRPSHLSLIHSSTHLTKIHYCTLTTFLYTQQPTNCLHPHPPSLLLYLHSLLALILTFTTCTDTDIHYMH